MEGTKNIVLCHWVSVAYHLQTVQQPHLKVSITSMGVHCPMFQDHAVVSPIKVNDPTINPCKTATTHLETAGKENPMTKHNFLDVVLNSTASKCSKLITNMRTEHTQNVNYCELFIEDDHTHYTPPTPLLLLMLKRLFKIQSFKSS